MASAVKYHTAASDEEAVRDEAPAYEERANTNSAPPPSYNSIFGELKQAKRDSGGSHVNFLKQACGIVLSSVVTILLLALLCAFPVSMIIIGALKLDDCPAEHFIPKWLLIFGCFGLAANLFMLARQIINKARKSDNKDGGVNPIECILQTFLLAWFIAGNVWVYRTYKFVKYDKDAGDDYCDKLLYLFSFWTITSSYIMMAAGCVLCCVCIICIAIVGGASS